MIPRILIIAGSDSGGGAGIQADIKTVSALGGHAMTAVTAITAQNTLGVQRVMPVPADMVLAQIESCAGDIGVDAVKIGMLGSAETARVVADWLERVDVPVVLDPVMVATSGDTLADAETIAAFERLITLTTVTTPNTAELAVLSGNHDGSDLGVWEAGSSLAQRHSTSILVTGTTISGGVTYSFGRGGRTPSEDTEQFLYDRLFTSHPDSGFKEWEWAGRVIDTRHSHGTGCTLASAIAVGLSAGKSLPDAVEQARAFVRASLVAAPGLGKGHGPMGQQFVNGFSCQA